MSNEFVASRPANILLVEDNDNDVELTRMSFKMSKMKVNLFIANDGVECMDFLRKQGQFIDVPLPDLILLDLNMPRMDGREVLTELARDEQFRHLPVVILTTSAEEKEILKMYKLRCSSYIVKPVDFEQFHRAIRTITESWFEVVVFPNGRR